MKKDKRIEIRISSELLERLKVCMANDSELNGKTIADVIRNEIEGYCGMIEDENSMYVQKENVRTKEEVKRTYKPKAKENVRTQKEVKQLPKKYKGLRLPANW